MLDHEAGARPDQHGRRRPRRQPRPDPRADRRGAGGRRGSRVFPELAVTGYPPEDLLLRPGFIRAAERSLAEIAEAARGIAALVGTPHFDRRPLQRLRRLCGRRDQGDLPQAVPAELRRLRRGPLLRAGRELFLVRLGDVSSARRSARTSGSPARLQRTSRSPAPSWSRTSRPRRSMSARTASGRRCWPPVRATTPASSRSCNAVGGQDELIFDGHSLVLDDEGRCSRARPASRSACSSSTSTRPRPSAVGCGTFAAAPSRANGTPEELPVRRRRLIAGRPERQARAAAARADPRRPRADAARAGARAERLRGEERLHRRGRRRLRRDRLRADGGARSRGARPGARSRRLDALALLVGGHAKRRGTARGEPRHRLPRAADRRDRDRLRGGARRELRRP